MARKIKGTIYRLQYTASWYELLECSSKQDLFEYIAKQMLNSGIIVVGVNELCKDGSTPKVAVYTDKEYKEIYKKLKKEKEGK